MKMLIICYWYPPVNNPRSYRWSAVAERWVSAGHTVEVVAGWFPGLAREESIAGVRVHRPGGDFSARLRGRFGNPGGHLDVGPARHGQSGAVRRALAWLNNHLWRNLWWPDYACLWRRPALTKALEVAAAGGFDALVSVSEPFTGHLVGRAVARCFPHLPWLVDVGDPFSLREGPAINNTRLYGGLNHRADAGVANRATAVTVTNEGLLEQCRKAFPAAEGKLFLVPPLLSAEPPLNVGVPPRGDGRLRLVTVGTLYRDVRHPGILLEIFRRLLDGPLGERLELHFYGQSGDCADCFEPWRPWLDKKLFLHGVVPRREALAAMADADCLVHFGNATTNQLPSKVVEYAAAGRPIVNLVYSASDTSAAFLRPHPAVLNLGREAGEGLDAQAARLAAFIAQPPAIDRAKLDLWLDICRVGPVAARFEQLLAAPVGPTRR